MILSAKVWSYRFITAFALIFFFIQPLVTSAFGAIEFIGKGTIPGSAIDNLKLTDPIDAAGTPQNRMGGFGSAIAYTGSGNLFIAIPDRGPADGKSTYLNRYYWLSIAIDPIKHTVTPSLVSTQLLSQGPNQPKQVFTGNSEAFDSTNSPASRRFDPEAIRMGKTGTIFISDEYGPFIYEFDRSGLRLRSLKVPDKFLIKSPGVPSADPDTELTNPNGRQPNGGMEGLAINPDGTKLYGITENPLIQDHALDIRHKRVGINHRILEIDIKTGATREFLYQLERKKNRVNEILAVNNHEFLVLERENKAGDKAVFKKIFKIDLAGATDISNIDRLPEKDVPSGVKKVAKSLFLDLLDPAYGLAGPDFPKKIEGLAFGPSLPDGRISLLVTSDNDFHRDKPSIIYVFAIDPSDLNYVPQVITPMSDKQ
ncbi:esterase-like activity of phytase family protein [Desulfobacca acetoxidans]|uniref:Phytase-like domain-containing protein n=1 Tax=Desulfobacca acetoxidans (strain ATCC 700848 / DSM 11109 / ASRB2) TaxID=880072 RepID=F2NJP3_DESAR|nr:esterase-like activity of phytase family protein [Desulfobacca acetoxidans]AEB09698.1 hypothetical protein Desac_1860 [Desulfobacca acetoxidans DSM 11109]